MPQRSLVTSALPRCAVALLSLCLIVMAPAQAETLRQLAQRCAPFVAERTTLAIVQVESGGNPWIIHDGTLDKAVAFASRSEAAAYIDRRLAGGGEVWGIGLAQVNADHLGEYGVTAYTLLEPCTNLAVGMDILRSYWRAAVVRYGPTREALEHAFEAYQGGTGSWTTHSARYRRQVETYARTVWAIAAALPFGGRP